MPPPTDRKPGLHSFLMALPHSSPPFPGKSAKRIHSAPFVGFACSQEHWPFYSPPPVKRACLSPQGDFMLYSTVPQPVDEDLVQRLREKEGL